MQRRIDPTSERARYRQLADILRHKITAGEWSPDQTLPSERDLGHEYAVSQTTVRKALAILAAESLVVTEPGLPWKVRERGEPSVVHAQPGDRVRARIATRDDHEQHGIPEGTVVLVVSRDGEPDRLYRADSYEYQVGPAAT
jgi:DNA-binding GntR family transcriptional regulator